MNSEEQDIKRENVDNDNDSEDDKYSEDDNDSNNDNNNNNNNDNNDAKAKDMSHEDNSKQNINNANMTSNPISRQNSFRHQKSLSQRQLQEVNALLSRRLTLINTNENDQELMKIEMSQLNDDKSLYSELFDKIDSKHNGDLDLNEWIQGLKRLKVTLNEGEMKTIFQCMDGEDSDFVSREDFIAFCIRPFQSISLKQLQQQLIQQVIGHVKQPSNLIRANDNIQEWDSIAMESMQREMQQHMVSLTASMVDSVQGEAKFYEEIEKHANDPSFANPDKAPEWSPAEVAFWLDSIDFGQYSRRFHDDAIDGSILLNDVDRALLQIEMGIKPLHVGKMLREIDKLRKKHPTVLHTPYKDWYQLSKENELLTQQLNQTLQKVQELEIENTRLKLTSNNNINNFHDNNDQSLSNIANNITKDGSFIEDKNKDKDSETKDEKDEKDEKIVKLTKEIELLQKSKYDLVIATDKELQSLRKIIRLLSGEYETLQTPMYKRYNPLDSIMRGMGYEKHP